MSNGAWTDEENDLIVADYFAMLADDISARRYSKGSQYTSEQFQHLLLDNGITCSMSRAGNGWDNSAPLGRMLRMRLPGNGWRASSHR